jgi:hypothetical protein
MSEKQPKNLKSSQGRRTHKRHHKRDHTESRSDKKPEHSAAPKKDVQKEIDRRVASEVYRLTSKTPSELSFEAKHNVQLKRLPRLSSSGKIMMVFEMAALRVNFSGKGEFFRAHISRLAKPEMDSINEFIREAVHTIFHMQEPKAKLYMTRIVCTTSAGGAINVLTNDVNIQGSSYMNFTTSWAAIFDEVKMIEGHIEWIPNYIAGATTANISNKGVLVIDYDHVAVLTGYDQGLNYDSHIEIDIEPPYGAKDGGRSSITWHAQGQPDLVWQDTSATTAIAWCKIASRNVLNAATGYGDLTGSAHMQFRMTF